MIRRVILLLLVLIMVPAMTPAAYAAEPYTLDIYWIGNGDNPGIREGVEAAVNAYIEPLIDAHVSFHIIGWDDYEDEVIHVLTDREARKGVKMDLVFTADWKGYSDLVEANALLPLGDQLKENGQDILASLPEGYWNGVRINSSIYGVPTNKELCVPMGFVVNKTAAGAIGWDPEKDEIKTTADLEPWLQKYKEMFPDKYPYLMDTDPPGRWVDEPWCPDWSGLENNAVSMRMAMNEDGEYDDNVYSIFETPEEEEHIRLIYRWAQAGYIHPDAANMTKAESEAFFGRGDFLVYTMALKGSNIKGIELYNEKHPKDAEPFEVTEIIMQPKYIATAHTAGSMFAIPSSPRPDLAMKYLNLMHSDPVLVNLMLFGVEGVNYEKVDDLRVRLTDEAWYNVHGGAWTVGDVTLQMVLETEDPEKNPKLIEFADGAAETGSLGFRFNRKKLKDEVEAVNEAVRTYFNPLMCGAVDPDDPEKGIEAGRKALKDAGIDTLREAAQDQYDKWKNAQW